MKRILKDNPVRKLRREMDLTISDLCSQCGISFIHLQRIEHGLAHQITLEVRGQLMAFGFPETIDMEYLEWKHAMEISTGNKRADVTARQIEHRRQLADM